MKRTFFKNENGAAAVELALLLPLLTLIFSGIIIFGIIFHSYLGITHAAREGVRWAALRSPAGEVISKTEAAGGGIDWSKATVTVEGVPAGGATDDDQGNPVTVRVTYQLPSIVGDLGGALNSLSSMIGAGPVLPSTITSEATQRVE